MYAGETSVRLGGLVVSGQWSVVGGFFVELLTINQNNPKTKALGSCLGLW